MSNGFGEAGVSLMRAGTLDVGVGDRVAAGFALPQADLSIPEAAALAPATPVQPLVVASPAASSKQGTIPAAPTGTLSSVGQQSSDSDFKNVPFMVISNADGSVAQVIPIPANGEPPAAPQLKPGQSASFAILPNGGEKNAELLARAAAGDGSITLRAKGDTSVPPKPVQAGSPDNELVFVPKGGGAPVPLQGEYGTQFFSTINSANPGGKEYARVTKNPDGSYQIGFDDQLGGGDNDRNDSIIGYKPVANKPPVADPALARLKEDHRLVATGKLPATDPEGRPLTYTLPGGTTLPNGNQVARTPYGTVVLEPDGDYQVYLHNKQPHVQGLGEGERRRFSVPVQVSDGLTTTTTAINATVRGTNDAPTKVGDVALGGLSPTAPTSAGTLVGTVTDVDRRDTQVYGQPQPASQAGVTLGVDAAGNLAASLNPNDPAYKALPPGTHTLTFQVPVTDQHGAQAVDASGNPTTVAVTVPVTKVQDLPTTITQDVGVKGNYYSFFAPPRVRWAMVPNELTPAKLIGIQTDHTFDLGPGATPFQPMPGDPQNLSGLPCIRTADNLAILILDPASNRLYVRPNFDNPAARDGNFVTNLTLNLTSPTLPPIALNLRVSQSNALFT